MQAQDFYSMKKRFCCGCIAVFTKSIYDNTVIDETNLRRTDNTGRCLPGALTIPDAAFPEYHRLFHIYPMEKS